MSAWTRIKQGWTSGWKALSDQASRLHARRISENPAAYAEQTAAFQTELAASRAALDRMKTRLPVSVVDPADKAIVLKYVALERRWHDLAAGLYADATPAGAAGQPAVGVAPVLIVGGLALTAVGVAWATAAYQYAVNLREHTALAERELDARIAASRDGRVLQTSTLPPPPPPPGAGGDNLGLWVLGGLAVVTGAAVLPTLLKR